MTCRLIIIGGTCLLAGTAPSIEGAHESKASPCPSPPGVFRGGPLPIPAKLVHVEPRFPERETPTHIGRQLWLGEIEIGVDGSVRSVRILRRVTIAPAWPEWEEAIPAAVRQWRYAVPCLMGKPHKVLLAVAFDPIARTFRGGSHVQGPEPSGPPNKALQPTRGATNDERRSQPNAVFCGPVRGSSR